MCSWTYHTRIWPVAKIFNASKHCFQRSDPTARSNFCWRLQQLQFKQHMELFLHVLLLICYRIYFSKLWLNQLLIITINMSFLTTLPMTVTPVELYPPFMYIYGFNSTFSCYAMNLNKPIIIIIIMIPQIQVFTEGFYVATRFNFHAHILSDDFSFRSLHEIRFRYQSVNLLVLLTNHHVWHICYYLNKMPYYESHTSTLVVQLALFLTGCQC